MRPSIRVKSLFPNPQVSLHLWKRQGSAGPTSVPRHLSIDPEREAWRILSDKEVPVEIEQTLPYPQRVSITLHQIHPRPTSSRSSRITYERLSIGNRARAAYGPRISSRMPRARWSDRLARPCRTVGNRRFGGWHGGPSSWTRLVGSDGRRVWSMISAVDSCVSRYRHRWQGIRLPPKKVAPTSTTNFTVDSPMFAASTPHSPLSPLTSGSAAYPDGLITPTWVRKHSEILPSVFVHFARLYEHSFSKDQDQASRGSPSQASNGRLRSRAGTLDATDPINVPIPPTPAPSSPSMAPAKSASETANLNGSAKELEKQRREAEKRADEELVREIADRRKKLVDKVTGIKLTVVLMASRDALGQYLRGCWSGRDR